MIPFSFDLVDVLEVLVGKAALMDRMAIGDRVHLRPIQQRIEDAGARDVEHIGQGVLPNILYDSLNEPGNIGIPRPAGDEVVAQLPAAAGYIELFPFLSEHPGERPDLVGVDIQIDTAHLVQHQQPP